MTEKWFSGYDSGSPFPHALFLQADRFRRGWGKVADEMGWGPQESAYRIVFREPGLKLRSYGEGAVDGPVVLIIPTLIKGAYIWDLISEASVVQRCTQRGLRVYLIEWTQAGEQEQAFGLADYTDRLILDCLNTLLQETGRSRVFLMGHSLGGTLAAMFSALYPEKVAGLILIGAPLYFGKGVGDIDALVARMTKYKVMELVQGNVPGSLLSGIAWLASPVTFGWGRWVDWLNCISDSQAMGMYLRVERWTFEEKLLAQRLFEEVVELLYRENRFMRGTLVVGGKRVVLERIEAPLLCVADKRCHLVPPGSVLPFHQAHKGSDKKILWYTGDTGVSLQHVGMLVGRQAHRVLWPQVLDWIDAHDQQFTQPFTQIT